MSAKRIYVSGLWVLQGNPKRSLDHYDSLLPATLDLLTCSTLYFYSDDLAILERVRGLSSLRGIETRISLVPVAMLPGWKMAENAMQSCKAMSLSSFSRPQNYYYEKGVTHYWRDLKDGGSDVYKGMLAIWLSKVFLTAAVSRERRGSVAWVDASVSRFNGKRTYWNFPSDNGYPGKISHYGSPMNFYGAPLPINASYLEGDTVAWERCETLFQEKLRLALKMPYGHDEETVLAECVKSSPDLFRKIGSPLSSEGKVRAFTWKSLHSFLRLWRIVRGCFSI